jgi:hypothetical protein
MKIVIALFAFVLPLYCSAQSTATAGKLELQYASEMYVDTESSASTANSKGKVEVYSNGAFYRIGENELICDSAILKGSGSFQAFEVTLLSRNNRQVVDKIKGDVFYYDSKKNTGVLTGNIKDRNKKVIAQKMELDFSSGPFTIVNRT